MHISIYVIIAWNVITALVYGLDKLFAKKRKRRISESALLLIALLMGGVGAMFGMILFNHKTSKMKFRLLVPMLALLNVALYFLLRT